MRIRLVAVYTGFFPLLRVDAAADPKRVCPESLLEGLCQENPPLGVTNGASQT